MKATNKLRHNAHFRRRDVCSNNIALRNVFFKMTQEAVNVLIRQVSILLCFLLYPGLFLIDYGHFQYP